MNRLIVFFLLLVSWPAAAVVEVECHWNAADSSKTRLLLDLSAPAAHRIFTLDQPDRVVIDIVGAQLRGTLPAARTDDPLLIGVRAGVRLDQELRIVLDLKHPVRVKSFAARGSERAPARLIIELTPQANASGLQPVGNQKPAPNAWSGQSRTAIVAIDAGHGGEDPGAIGPGGTREKDVTLAIARKLAQLIERKSGLRAVMIRDGDYYIGLRERAVLARERNADLLISIHADAYENADAQGSSVYVLSEGAASSETASRLAERENGADRRSAGVDIQAGDALLASVLHELTQTVTHEHSSEAAGSILRYLKRVGAVHQGSVQRAAFVVLKSPDVPSLLVETAFISNADEERRLRNPAHQQRLAQAMLSGIEGYLSKHPPQGLRAANVHDRRERSGSGMRSAASQSQGTSELREYVITPGDTLSDIAKRHRVSIGSLRAENGLGDSDMIRVGQVIAIPTDS